MFRRLPPSDGTAMSAFIVGRIVVQKLGRRVARWTGAVMAKYGFGQERFGYTPSKRAGLAAGTWRWLCVKYFSPPNTDDSTQEYFLERRKTSPLFVTGSKLVGVFASFAAAQDFANTKPRRLPTLALERNRTKRIRRG